MIPALDLNHIDFTYPSAPEPLFEDVSARFARGWTALLGSNGIGKTTLVRLALGDIRPDAGSVRPAHRTYAAACCAQRIDEPPTNLADFAADWSPEAMAIRSALGIGDDWCWRWSTLSGGEAKRLQLACAFAARPDVLVLDEPTNHVDAAARDAIAAAMRLFDGVGIVVSHDAALIDATCTRCVMLERRHARGRNVTVAATYQGGYAQASAQRQADDLRDDAALDAARRTARRLAAERTRRAEHARELDARKRRGLRVDPNDHDARNLLKYGKPTLGTAASRAAAQLDGRLDAARRATLSLSVAAKRYDGDIWMGVEPSHRRELIHVAAGVIRYGEAAAAASPNADAASPRARLAVGPRGVWTLEETDPNGDGLLVPELSVGPRDHIAITGPNGLGKTTLIRAMLNGAGAGLGDGLGTSRGAAGAGVSMLAIGQRAGADAERRAMAELAGLSHEHRSRALAAYARLNADPDRLVAAGNGNARSAGNAGGETGGVLSPGELRKLMLALGAARGVQLIVMDEPTNHLDIDSRAALARMLRNFPGAVIVATHDALLLDDGSQDPAGPSCDPAPAVRGSRSAARPGRSPRRWSVRG